MNTKTITTKGASSVKTGSPELERDQEAVRKFQEQFTPAMFFRAEEVGADPRPQDDSPAYGLGQYYLDGVRVTIDVWAVPAIGKFVMRDLDSGRWYTSDLPQDS